MTEAHTNLIAAWDVMLTDNIPGQVRPDAASSWPKALAVLKEQFSDDQLALVEAELAPLRRPDDVLDLDSPLWQVCCGEDANEHRVAASVLTDAVLEELFEATGVVI